LLFDAYATLGMLESLDREDEAPTWWTQSKKELSKIRGT